VFLCHIIVHLMFLRLLRHFLRTKQKVAFSSGYSFKCESSSIQLTLLVIQLTQSIQNLFSDTNRRRFEFKHFFNTNIGLDFCIYQSHCIIEAPSAINIAEKITHNIGFFCPITQRFIKNCLTKIVLV